MLLECPKNCKSPARLVRCGYFFRKSDSKTIQRWKCSHCQSTFSDATGNPCFGQNKRRLNSVIRKSLMGKTSQRRIALLYGTTRKTVARKIRFLGMQKRAGRLQWLERYKEKKICRVQFDDMETFEHSKCKPVAISLMVEEKTRKILDFEVSSMAAKGLLAAISRKKYGLRQDGRRKAWRRIFGRAQGFIDQDSEFKSDELPFYPGLVQEFFPRATHKKFKGRRGCVVGHGELKAGGFDPLFDLNHTCAMIRDGLGRLVRRTWCTTKKLDSLRDQLEIYIDFHNSALTK